MTTAERRKEIEDLGYRLTPKKYPEYYLFDKDGYLGEFSIASNGVPEFNLVKYDVTEQLIDAIKKYNSTLPWPSDSYCPLYTEEHRIDCRIDYFLKNLGFKFSDFLSQYKKTYRLVFESDKNYVITVSYLVNSEHNIDVSYYFSEEAGADKCCTNLDEVISFFSTIISSVLINLSAEAIYVLCKLKSVNVNSIKNSDISWVDGTKLKRIPLIGLLKKQALDTLKRLEEIENVI